MSTLLRLATLAPLALAACSNTPNTEAPSPQTDRVPAEVAGTYRHYGTAHTLGAGKARAYVVLDEQNNNRPLEVGVALSAGALDQLPAPAAPLPGGGHNHADSHEYLLTLPAGHGTRYQFIKMDWNAAGHEPPGIYDVPHFDFHFYTISQAARLAIDPDDPAYATKAARFPAPAYVPPRYMVLPPPPAPVEVVPRMGVHWLDVTSPELQPPTSPSHRPFTHTFIHGSWDGHFIFDEPMITRAFLLSKPDITVPLPQAAEVEAPGYYPTTYRILYDASAREYRIALGSLVKR